MLTERHLYDVLVELLNGGLSGVGVEYENIHGYVSLWDHYIIEFRQSQAHHSTKLKGISTHCTTGSPLRRSGRPTRRAVFTEPSKTLGRSRGAYLTLATKPYSSTRTIATTLPELSPGLIRVLRSRIGDVWHRRLDPTSSRA